MRQDPVAQHPEQQLTKHRGLHGGHLFARLEIERGKTQNFVGIIC